MQKVSFGENGMSEWLSGPGIGINRKIKFFALKAELYSHPLGKWLAFLSCSTEVVGSIPNLHTAAWTLHVLLVLALGSVFLLRHA